MCIRPLDLARLRRLSAHWIMRPAMTVEIRVEELNALLDEIEQYQDIARELRTMRELLRELHDDALRLHALVQVQQQGARPPTTTSEGA